MNPEEKAPLGSPENPLSEEQAQAIGIDTEKVVAEAKVLDAPPVEAYSIEPRKRYRGHLVIADGERTVGEQTFKHIKLDDGSEYDLSEADYAAEVKVSYPPTA